MSGLAALIPAGDFVTIFANRRRGPKAPLVIHGGTALSMVANLYTIGLNNRIAGGKRMLIEHGGRRPQIDPTAWVAPNATLSGAVQLGPGARILYGAVLTAEGADLRVGPRCVIMEQAVLRAAGRFPLTLGEEVLVGPHAYLSGCTVGPRTFIATGAMVFNGASLGEACVVALGGKVHIDTELPADTWVPIGHTAFGRPGRVYPPDDAPAVHEQLNRLNFMRYVFGVDSDGKSRTEVMAEAMRKYSRALAAHADDTLLAE